MGQTSLDDDELFGEAADDMRSDIEASLSEARAALPDPDDVWETDADNVVGVLNGLRAATDPGDAEEHLRDAKKWYTMGQRADAFDDAEDLADDVEAVEDLLAELAAVRESVSDLAGTVPQLRNTLEEARGGDGESGDGGADETDDEDAAAEDGETPAAEADGGEPQEQATLDDDE